jgi:2-polyprenyl-6-hydroxyphenyl methylase/3-demethylubiquinone-9 3-methyltransferase
MMPAATANLDPREIAQFEALAAEWWDLAGPFAMLHRLGPARLGIIRDAVRSHFPAAGPGRRILKGLTCLDAGCGGGLVAEPLARLGGTVTAIDPAEGNIAAARHHAGLVGLEIDYRATTAEDLSAAGATFDLVTCLEVIEHVPDPAAFVATIAALVKPGGLAIFSTLNRTPQSYALAIVGAEYVLAWVPRGTHHWHRFVTPRELADYCTAAGLETPDTEGIVFDPLRDQWRRSSDTGVNYMATAAKPAAVI